MYDSTAAMSVEKRVTWRHKYILQEKIQLINELASRLTDIYFNSKAKRQRTLEDHLDEQKNK
jgi:hypothetical protein